MVLVLELKICIPTAQQSLEDWEGKITLRHRIFGYICLFTAKSRAYIALQHCRFCIDQRVNELNQYID